MGGEAEKDETLTKNTNTENKEAGAEAIEGEGSLPEDHKDLLREFVIWLKDLNDEEAEEIVDKFEAKRNA